MTEHPPGLQRPGAATPYNRNAIPIRATVRALLEATKPLADGGALLPWSRRPPLRSPGWPEAMAEAGCADAVRTALLVGDPQHGARFASDEVVLGLRITQILTTPHSIPTR